MWGEVFRETIHDQFDIPLSRQRNCRRKPMARLALMNLMDILVTVREIAA